MDSLYPKTPLGVVGLVWIWQTWKKFQQANFWGVKGGGMGNLGGGLGRWEGEVWEFEWGIWGVGGGGMGGVVGGQGGGLGGARDI